MPQFNISFYHAASSIATRIVNSTWHVAFCYTNFSSLFFKFCIRFTL